MQKKMPGQQPHPLLGRFDLDPGRWRPLYYGTKVSVPVSEGGVGRGSITINNQPYILTRITHKIVGNTANPEASGLYQDGQYDFAFRDELSNYQNEPIPADAMFGSVQSGYLIELPFPIPFSGNKTITFELINRVSRTLTPPIETFLIQIVLHGVADWGELSR